MKTKKIISLVLTLIIMATMCIAAIPSASAATDNVNLVYAKSIITGSSFPNIICAVTGYVEVENLAYDKNVVIHYTTDGITWKDCNATYFKQGTGNKEIWEFTTDTFNSSYKSYVDVNFAIKYEVNGQTYWDSNNGQNYYLKAGATSSDTFILGNSNVALSYCKASTSLEGGYYGSIYVKNLALQKDVKVRYTTNNWASYQEVSAEYSYSNAAGTIDNFTFTIDETAPIEFVVSYTVNGQTYWDNNFGDNYTCSF